MTEKEVSIKPFVKEYFESIDFDYWEKRLNFCLDKLSNLKTDKAKSPYIVDLYSIYLQLLEIFFTNSFILSYGEDRFFDFLFVGNIELRNMVEAHVSDRRYLDWILDNLIFGIEAKNQINDYERKRADHLNILKEAGKDYLDHYEFLNAFKHGYRVHSGPGARLSVNGMTLVDVDSQLIYYSKRKIGKTNRIFRHRILFNHKRTLGKAFMMLGMLKNCQAVFLTRYNPSKEVTIINYFIDYREEWRNSFGGATFHEELFILKRETK